MNKTALITGASSGIGYEFAKQLSNLGYDLILVARREDRLLKLQSELKTKSEIILKDLSQKQNCIDLFNEVKDKNIEMLINNAGFGLFGRFDETDLERELDMISLNCTAVHILMKLFIKKFEKQGKGYILNVASSAGFMPGPLMATYYSSKAYVLNLTRAIAYELKKKNSNVKISALCPGPVLTEFNDVADVSFSAKPATAKYVVSYTLKKMFAGKTTIIPTLKMKLAIFATKIAPSSVIVTSAYHFQKKKLN